MGVMYSRPTGQRPHTGQPVMTVPLYLAVLHPTESIYKRHSFKGMTMAAHDIVAAMNRAQLARAGRLSAVHGAPVPAPAMRAAASELPGRQGSCAREV